MTNRVLVTGGCGFIGANLVPALAEQGWEVTVLDNCSRGLVTNEITQCARLIVGDILDHAAVASAITGVKAVIHLAAFGSVIESMLDPMPNFQTNALGTLRLLEACRQNHVPRFVFASTGGAIIGNAVPPVSESSLPRPISPYGASKLCGEAYCHAYAMGFGLETVALRFANVYGPRSMHKKGAVTTFMKSMLMGRPLTIYGDGKASRDYIFVDDLCRGIQRGLEAGSAGSIFHLASGVETNVLELAMQISKVAGISSPRYEFRPARPGEITRNFAKTEKAKLELDFESRVPLHEGLSMTWEWFKQQPRNQDFEVESDS